MKSYTLPKNGFPKFRRRLIIRTGIIYLIFLAILIGVALFNSRDSWPFVLLIIIPIFIVIGGFSYYRLIKQQHALWDSVRIEVGDDYVARQQIRVPGIRINRGEVASLREINNGLCILSADKVHSLLIPIELDNSDYKEIKTAISTWATIQPKSPTEQINKFALTMVLIIGFGIVLLSTSAWLVLAVGLALIGFYGYYIYVLLQFPRSKGVDPKLARNLIIVFCFLLFITGVRAFSLFFGY